MQLITNNKQFMSDYQQLEDVSLNPERHTASSAYEHCEMVVRRVKQLAKLNECTAEEMAELVNLAYVHDIGKITGTSKPEKSVEKLHQYGNMEEGFVNLVKYHDINLPWYISYTKDESPSDKAWNKLFRKVNIQLLCLFMVADRIDCPGSWSNNKPLVWFLDECRVRMNLSIRTE